MPVIFGGLFILLLANASLLYVSSARHHQATTQIRGMADSLTFYAGHVADYARVNPSASGEATHVELALPRWYTPRPQLHNHIENGVAFTYHLPDAEESGAALLGEIAATCRRCGRKLGKYIVSVSGVAVGDAPQIIPEGSLVVIR